MNNEIPMIRYGNIYNPKFNGNSYGGYIYSINGLAPALDTAQGGGRTPMIVVEEKNEREHKTDIFR